MSKKSELLTEVNQYTVQVIIDGKVVKADLPESELNRVESDILLSGIEDIVMDITGRKYVKKLAEGAYDYIGGLNRQWDGIEDAIEEYLNDLGVSPRW